MRIRYAKQSDFDFLVFGLEDNRKLENRPKKNIPIRPFDKALFRKGVKEKIIRILEKDGKSIGFLHFMTDFKLMHVYDKFFWIDLIYELSDKGQNFIEIIKNAEKELTTLL